MEAPLSMPMAFLAILGAATFCRFGGYLVMRFLPPSHRLDAALRATPLAVMAGISAQALAAGGMVEAAAIGTAIALALLLRNDVLSAILGVAVAALLRWQGF